jgi:hypothetical protein
MRADYESDTMHPSAVVDVIRYMAESEPVRVTCSCESRIWVSDNSTKWHVETFVAQHKTHGLLVVETKEEIVFMGLHPGVNCESSENDLE